MSFLSFTTSPFPPHRSARRPQPRLDRRTTHSIHSTLTATARVPRQGSLYFSSFLSRTLSIRRFLLRIRLPITHHASHHALKLNQTSFLSTTTSEEQISFRSLL